MCSGDHIIPLSGTNSRQEGMGLGEPIPITVESATSKLPCIVENQCYDPATDSIYAFCGHAVVRLGENGQAVLIAGNPTQSGSDQGPGDKARFAGLSSITSDGRGNLYVSGGEAVHKLQLPDPQKAPAPSTTAMTPADTNTSSSTGSGCQADTPVREGVVVSRLPLAGRRSYQTVIYDPLCRSLLLCSTTAVYRYSLEPGAAEEPVLLAGLEGEAGSQDGVGSRARFGRIWCGIVDGLGCAWVYDKGGTAGGQIRRIDPSGTVKTIITGLPDFRKMYNCLSVLPNGYLAAVALCQDSVLFLDLGLKPNACHAAAAPPPSHSLPSDLGALLDRQPDGSADVTVEVGGQAFQAHRTVLVARSEYFRQRLDPGAGFADGGAQQLSLPDADPAAFGLVLRYMYTDRVEAVPHGLLQPVGELADRLLLPGLCEEVGKQLLGTVCASSVVGLLLWAEQRGARFGLLLAGLKAWFVEQRQEVGTGHAAAVKQLWLSSPDLAWELHYGEQQEAPSAKRRRA